MHSPSRNSGSIKEDRRPKASYVCRSCGGRSMTDQSGRWRTALLTIDSRREVDLRIDRDCADGPKSIVTPSARTPATARTCFPRHAGSRRVSHDKRRTRGVDDGVVHGLHVGRRAADDAQDVGSGGLPGERLLRLVEQARVLDRDHGLVRERLRERYLLVVEAAERRAQDRDAADRAACRAAEARTAPTCSPAPMRGRASAEIASAPPPCRRR